MLLLENVFKPKIIKFTFEIYGDGQIIAWLSMIAVYDLNRKTIAGYKQKSSFDVSIDRL